MSRLAIPRAAWICALVACFAAVSWSLITPPFQTPDETAHYAYAEHVARDGRPPVDRPHAGPGEVFFSEEQEAALHALAFGEVVHHPENSGIWSPTQQRQLEQALAVERSRDADGYTFGTGPQPPLYYALAAIPYRMASDGTVLDRLAAMRIVSALLAGVAVLFVFLFLRELLPGARWGWTVGSLGVALQPLFGFMSGSVNSDAWLFAASAAAFLCVARAFRHGVSRELALATGAVLALGTLGKLTFLGLVPGVLLALVLASWRAHRPDLLATLRRPAAALAIVVAAIALYTMLNLAVWDRQALAFVGSNVTAATGGTLADQLSYAWQLYLPALPGMTPVVPGYVTTWEMWLKGFVGLFGWLETAFAEWVYVLASAVFAALAALVVRALALQRVVVRRRSGELAAYAVCALGMVVLVAGQSYATDRRIDEVFSGGQVRYLLPLLPLYGAALALAVRGAGRRWAPVVGTSIVVLASAHTLFAQLLVVARYYA